MKRTGSRTFLQELFEGRLGGHPPGPPRLERAPRGSPERRVAERRVADRHALLNLAALALFGVALALRAGGLDDPRPPAVAVALSASALVLLGWANFLGGRLVYEYGVGVRLRGQEGVEGD